MTDNTPERSEWKTVWLGDPADPEHAKAGWLPVEAEVRTSQLAVFERKVTIGDATKDSDDYISSWIVSDLSGGLGILNLNEGTDTNKFYWGIAETRYVNQVALPPLVKDWTLPTGAVGGCYPIGDVYDETTGDAQTHYFAWGPDPDNSNRYNVFGWNATAKEWYARTNAGSHSGRLTAKPLHKGVPFRGYADRGYTSTYVPLGTAGYARIDEDTAGQAVVTCIAPADYVAGTDDGQPAALCMTVFDDRLWALDTLGRLWKTPGNAPGETNDRWTVIEAPSETTTAFLEMTIDLSQRPRQLIPYLNAQGQPALCLVTDQGLWMFQEVDTSSGTWTKTAVQYPPHPDFGLGAAVWRPGEDLHIAAGMDTVRFTSANVIVPLSGPNAGDGVPREYLGRIVDLQAELSAMYALVDGLQATAADTLLAWTGTGWHCVWAGDAVPTWMSVSKVAAGYSLWWGETDGSVYEMPLRRTFHNPRAAQNAETGVGIDQYAAYGYVDTGRFDANMTGFDRIASHVVIDADWAGPSHPIKVSYQTEATPTWVELGTVDTAGITSISFDPNGDGFSEGKAFNWIQFRFELSRAAGNVAISPIMRSFMMGFVKIPQNTESFVFTVPLPKRTWMGRTANEIVDFLEGLLTAPGFLKLVHQDRSYRVKVAGISGADATGDDYSGARTVNVIAIPEGPGGEA